MRVMLIVKATDDSEAGQMPTTEQLTAMGAFNQELVSAGIMLAGDGLRPSSKGARVTFTQKQATVTDGPFAETKELVSGFWILEVKTMDEAIEWARRVPFYDGEIEVRQFSEAEDFGDAFTDELRAEEAALRAQASRS